MRAGVVGATARLTAAAAPEVWEVLVCSLHPG